MANTWESMQDSRISFKEEAKQGIIDFLKDGYDGYLCDMHDAIFNSELYTEDEAQAIDILDSMGGYSVVAEIIQYQQDNFGEITGDFSKPVWVLSMFWYIIGEEAMGELFEDVENFYDYWDEEVTDESRAFLIAEAEKKMQEI